MMIGCGFPQDRQGMNLARQVALLAGLPETVPGTTVNRFCASSLQTIRMAFHAIKAGGETPSSPAASSRSPRSTAIPRTPKSSIEAVRRRRADRERLHPDGADRGERGRTLGRFREDMDRFAQRSQERAVAAQDSGFFGREIAPWDGVAADDGPRRGSTLEALAELDLQAGWEGHRRELLSLRTTAPRRSS